MSRNAGTREIRVDTTDGEDGESTISKAELYAIYKAEYQAALGGVDFATTDFTHLVFAYQTLV